MKWRIFLFVVGCVFATGESLADLPALRVSDDHRYLITADGKPFFWLGDTAWELFHRLTREEAEVYLRDRAAKGFNVIEAVALAEHEFDKGNAYGVPAVEHNDPLQPVEAYFAHVDWLVDQANALGMYIGFLPTWGDKWNKKWGIGPEIFTPENAERYGEWLGRRYRDKAVVWILGGDRPVETERHRAIICAMARGLKRGDEGRHLITFHPPRDGQSWFHNEDWLDFEMSQSGHRQYNTPNYENNLANLLLLPPKPTFDGESNYEGMFVRESPQDYFDEVDVRKLAYWNLLSGGCGHTYGDHAIWQFHNPERFKTVNRVRDSWRKALNHPGAVQMGYMKQLWETWPWTKLRPDQTILAGNIGTGGELLRAARAQDGSFAFIYAPTGRSFHVRLNKLIGSKVHAQWFDPRSGVSSVAGEFDLVEDQEFQPKTSGRGQDWLLIVKAISGVTSAPSNDVVP